MQKRLLLLVIILTNILFTYIVISNSARIINIDGVLYLETAEAYLQGGWHAAMQIYPWPFYSILIAWASQLFHCSLQYAAYTINVFFQIIICLGFFNLACIVKDKITNFVSNSLQQVEDNSRIGPVTISSSFLFMILATMVILFYPAFNYHRDFIIRDFGYWAFSLWGWFYLIRLNEKQSFLEGIKFNASMLFASLFRLEGIFLLLFGPLAMFFSRQNKMQEKLENFLKAYLITLIILISGLIYCWIHSSTLDSFGRLIELKAQTQFGIQAIANDFSQTKKNILHNVLTPLASSSASSLLIGGLIGVYIRNLIITLTPFYSILILIFLWKKSFSPTQKSKPILYTAILINFLVTFVFLMQSLFLNERYLFGLAFLLLLWVPPGLLWIYEKTRSEKQWLFSSILIFIIGITIVSLYHSGTSKAYIKEAGNWVHENLPEKALIYSNSPQLKFYIDRPFVTYQNNISDKNIQSVLQNAKMQNYAYLVFQVNATNVVLKNQLNQLLPQPIKVFRNERGDTVLVFRFGNK